MITRTFGKIVRGTATPFQLSLACLLASLIAFMPGFLQAPGLIICFTLLLIVLNANLVLAAIIGGVAKIVSLVLLPVSFHVGRALLDGPLQPLFVKLVNAPVLALFGFEHYATTGGLVLGLIFGALASWGVTKGVTTFRRQMVEKEKSSERFKKFTERKSVKALTFIFVGGGTGKLTYEQLLERKVGNPVRPIGVAFAALVVVLLFILQGFASGPIVTAALHRALERANGATVDLQEADLDLKSGRLTMTGLAMADPNELDRDLFRAARIEGDVSAVNLLRKRLQLDRVVISDGSTGEKRRTPGGLVGKPPVPTEVDETQWPDAKTIEEYIRNAREWKERLAQVRRWLEKVSSSQPESEAPPGEKRETLRERLAREARDKGYARVKATHLVTGTPTFTVSELLAEKVSVARLQNETVDITGRNLSTQPWLLDEPPELVITSSGDTLGFRALFGEFGTAQTNNILDFHYNGLPIAAVADNLALADTKVLEGGTIDFSAKGVCRTAGGIYVDLPLRIVLHNTTISLPKFQPQEVDQLLLPIGVRGPLDNPRLFLDEGTLAQTMANAGLTRAAEELKSRAQEKVKEEIGAKAGSLLDNILRRDEKPGSETPADPED